MSDDEQFEETDFTIEPAAIWGCRISGEDIRVYLSESQMVTLSNEAARLLLRALIQALEEE